MIVKYVWHDDPETVKTLDTEKDYWVLPKIFRPDSQPEYDEHIKTSFKKKLEQGLVLSYSIEKG